MADAQQAQEIWNQAIIACYADQTLSPLSKAFADLAHPVFLLGNDLIVTVGSSYIKEGIERNAAAILEAKMAQIRGQATAIRISVDETLDAGSARGRHARVETPAEPAPVAMPGPTPVTLPDSGSATPSVPSPAAMPEPAPRRTFEIPGYPNPSAFSAPSQPLAGAMPAQPTTRTTPRIGNAKAGSLSLHSPGASTPATPDSSYFDTPEDALKAQRAGLNPNYTFDTFVVGESNRMAHAFAQNVAEVPGGIYNPLFLYSDSGLGKTHLMHAIGNYALKMYPERNIRYVSAEEFTNAFINAVRDGTESRALGSFKDEFRTVDVLLIDDIQFIGGKESTVEEFFWTFEALINANKQIVITSDVHPNLLGGFEKRLISRFNQGIQSDITAPTLETRIAIIERKAAADGIEISRDVSEYIAENLRTNVREMEGALHRLAAFAGLNNQKIDVTLAQMALRDMISGDTIEITSASIMGHCAEFFGYSIDDLCSSSRMRELAYARQIAMYLCREMTELSLPKIGDLFGGRDHTTVIHACKKIKQEMTKPDTFRQITELTSRIKHASRAAD